MKEYDALREFRFGLSLVTRDGKMGAIGHTGREVVPCKYDYIYNDGNPWILYLVYDDKDEYMSREGIPYFKN